jgi:bacillithiol system protein YtxJ
MSDHFIPVTDTAAIDQLLEQSHTAPVLVFKDDPYCPISMTARRQLGQLDYDIPTIDVAHDNDVAQAIASRIGVKHASPQAILLRNGQAVWSASHHAITANAVTQATREHG